MTLCASLPASRAHFCPQSPEHLSSTPARHGSWRAKLHDQKAPSTDLLTSLQRGLRRKALGLKVETVAAVLPLRLLLSPSLSQGTLNSLRILQHKGKWKTLSRILDKVHVCFNILIFLELYCSKRSDELLCILWGYSLKEWQNTGNT